MTPLQAWAARNVHKYRPCPLCGTVQVKIEHAHCILCNDQINQRKIVETKELEAALSNHYGSETYTRHAIVKSFVLTEGAVCFRDNAGNGAFWLFDILATEPAIRTLALKTGFASVVLDVNDRNRAHLTVKEDANIAPIYANSIPYTDCPSGKWEFYLELSENPDGTPLIVCLLPSEH